MAEPMSAAAVADYFAASRVEGLGGFRALCNGLKALVIERAVRARRDAARAALQSQGGRKKASSEPRRGGGGGGLLDVVDLGCGKGGDVWKWSAYRVGSYLGLDGSAACVEEARRRHAGLVARGQTQLPATYRTRDICDLGTGLAEASVDVATAHFFLQFAFRSEAAARNVLRDAARVLRPGGVLAAILPDGDRVHALLSAAAPRDPRPVAFGHFWLFRYGAGTAGGHQRADSAYGAAYRFALTDDGCTEYLVSPRLLELLLAEHGFEPLLDSGGFSEPAQRFFAAADRGAADAVLQGQNCCETDWLSLGLFRVVLARRGAQSSGSSTSSAAAASSSSSSSPSSLQLSSSASSKEDGLSKSSGGVRQDSCCSDGASGTGNVPGDSSATRSCHSEPRRPWKPPSTRRSGTAGAAKSSSLSGAGAGPTPAPPGAEGAKT